MDVVEYKYIINFHHGPSLRSIEDSKDMLIIFFFSEYKRMAKEKVDV